MPVGRLLLPFRSDADLRSGSPPELFRSAAKQQRAVGSGPTARSSALVIRGHRPWPLLPRESTRERWSFGRLNTQVSDARTCRRRRSSAPPLADSTNGRRRCFTVMLPRKRSRSHLGDSDRALRRRGGRIGTRGSSPKRSCRTPPRRRRKRSPSSVDAGAVGRSAACAKERMILSFYRRPHRTDPRMPE